MNRGLICLLALFLLACPKGNTPGPKDVVELVPSDNEISGWNRSSALKIAENATQLFDLIDGEGQTYVDNGFVKCAFQSYTGPLPGGTSQLDLRVFDMGDTIHAHSVYDAVAYGSKTPWTDNPAGVEARIDESMQFAYRVEFWDDKFYVGLEISDKTDPALDIAKLFARNVSAAIHDSI